MNIINVCVNKICNELIFWLEYLGGINVFIYNMIYVYFFIYIYDIIIFYYN